MENHCFSYEVGIRLRIYMRFRVQTELDFAVFVTMIKRVRGFDPDRSRWIFSGVKKSSACLPSEGK
jgi:hypothetical protein